MHRRRVARKSMNAQKAQLQARTLTGPRKVGLAAIAILLASNLPRRSRCNLCYLHAEHRFSVPLAKISTQAGRAHIVGLARRSTLDEMMKIGHGFPPLAASP